MKKITALLAALMLWVCAVPAYADLQFSNNSTRSGQYRKVNLPSGMTIDANGNITVANIDVTSDLTFRTNLIANGRYGSGSTVLFSSSTTIQQSSLPYSIIYKAIGASATTETTKLPAGTPGQELTFLIYGAQSGSWTLQPDTAAGVVGIGWTSIKFTAIGQCAVLLYQNATLGWQIKYVNANTVTFPNASF